MRNHRECTARVGVRAIIATLVRPLGYFYAVLSSWSNRMVQLFWIMEMCIGVDSGRHWNTD